MINGTLFKQEWERLENNFPKPRRINKVHRIKWKEFRTKVLNQDPSFVKEIVDSLYSGDVWVLEDTYDLSFLEKFKEELFKWGLNTPSSFHKMLEGVPNFHRIVDKELSKNYSFEAVRHVYFLFPWNEDPFGVWPIVNDIWGTFKVLSGFSYDEYCKNRPNDGVVDRLVINHYPSGTGAIETHSDPLLFQRMIMGTRMNQKGTDFKTGGLYYVDKNGNKWEIEDELSMGHKYISYPTLLHGVNIIDEGSEVNWQSSKGRWFLGFSSTATDTVQNRHTGYSVKDVEKPESNYN